MPAEIPALEALATLHHAYFLGLQLMVNRVAGAQTSGEWIYRLFRQQHEQYFLQSFTKLGLSGLPDAVACARYHVLSNVIGGVPVEYAEESATKAWVRFRYPRWMFAGPTICGIAPEVSGGFLRGWYAHNGLTLDNPRLGFVCVSEDMTGEFGFCGYFREYETPLSDEDRLQYARGELPPAFDPAAQPALPAAGWDARRLAKAKRNYSLAYVRNGISALVEVLGREPALELGRRAARLIGLQYFAELAGMLNLPDGDYRDTASFLTAMFAGMDDETTVDFDTTGARATIKHRGLRMLTGLDDAARNDLLTCWTELWLGTIHAHRIFKEATVTANHDVVVWTITDRMQ